MSDIFLVKQTIIRMDTFCVPGTVLNTLRVWPHLILTWPSGVGLLLSLFGAALWLSLGTPKESPHLYPQAGGPVQGPGF